MSCNNPRLMLKVDFSKVDPAVFLVRSHFWKEHGFQVDKNKQFLYKLVSKNSNNLNLEKVLDEYNLSDSDYEILEIPCRQCIGCRLDYSKEWANRVDLESKKYKYNYFLTLTYDDSCSPKGELNNDTLSKEDFDNFIHDLRNYFRDNFHHIGIKYFGCGEYGDTTFRPHYHLILMNCPIPDLTINFPSSVKGSFIKKIDSYGVPMKFSSSISSIWNKGIITIQECSWNTSAYVSRYVLKKQTGNSSVIYEKLAVLPPFLRMSNGIGKEYLLEHKESLLNNPCIIVGRQNKEPLVSGLPRYYKKVLKEYYPDEYEKIVNSSRIYLDDLYSRLRDHQKIKDYRIRKEDRFKANNSINRDLKKS